MSEILINSRVNLGGKDVNNVGNLQFDTEEHKDNFKEYLGAASGGGIPLVEALPVTEEEVTIVHNYNHMMEIIGKIPISEAGDFCIVKLVNGDDDNMVLYPYYFYSQEQLNNGMYLPFLSIEYTRNALKGSIYDSVIGSQISGLSSEYYYIYFIHEVS